MLGKAEPCQRNHTWQSGTSSYPKLVCPLRAHTQAGQCQSSFAAGIADRPTHCK